MKFICFRFCELLSWISIGNVEHFLLLSHLFIYLSCLWDSSQIIFSLGTNCILKFPFRTGFLEIKSLRVYLLSKCFQFPFILESPCCWLTVLGWQVLVDIVWKPVGLGVCHELSAIILPFPFVDVAFLAGPSIFYLHLLCWGILMPCI